MKINAFSAARTPLSAQTPQTEFGITRSLVSSGKLETFATFSCQSSTGYCLFSILLCHKKGIPHHGRNEFAFFRISYMGKLKCFKFNFQCGLSAFSSVSFATSAALSLPDTWLEKKEREPGWNHKLEEDLPTLVLKKENHTLKERNWEDVQPNRITTTSVFIRRKSIGEILFSLFFF